MIKLLRVEKDGSLWSYSESCYGICYSPGIRIVPRIGRLFVFDSVENALEFLASEYPYGPSVNLGYELWRITCSRTRVRAKTKMSFVADVLEWWSQSQEFRDQWGSEVPMGTFFVNHLTLRSRLHQVAMTPCGLYVDGVLSEAYCV